MKEETDSDFVVDLARSSRWQRVAVLFLTSLIFLAAVRFVGRVVYGEFIQDPPNRFLFGNTQASTHLKIFFVLWMSSVVLGSGFASAAVVRSLKQILSIGKEMLRFRRTEIRWDSIRRLEFFQPVGSRELTGTYIIERSDGRRERFHVSKRDGRNPLVGRAIQIIAEKSRLPWIGLTLTRQSSSLAGFLRELFVASGVGSRPAFVFWLFRNGIFIRSSEVGLNLALYQWAVSFFILPFFGFVLLCASFFFFSPIDAHRLPYPGTTLIGDFTAIILILGWFATALGVNSMMALIRVQTRQREVFEAQLSAAREVQNRLLPAAAPSIEGFDIAGVCIPAQEVGGDYFDYIPLSDGGVAIPVADVSGKGLGPGLAMTLTKGALTARLESDDDLVAALSGVNRTIRRSLQSRMFVTIVLAKLSPAHGKVQILRAGHNPPLLVRSSGESRWVAPRGIAIGLAPGAVFERSSQIEELRLDSGDLLILYSDGLTEAMNGSAEEYGEKRLEDAVTRNRPRTAEEVKAAILDDVRDFRGNAEVNDDLTLVVIRAT